MTQSYLLTWNPDLWDSWPEFDARVEQTRRGELISEAWSTGIRKTIPIGSRVYLIRQSRDRGMIASGYTTSLVKEWPNSEFKRGADISWDALLHPDDVLPTEQLSQEIPGIAWNHMQGSGVSVPEELCEVLDQLWLAHLETVGHRSIDLSPGELALYSEGAPRPAVGNVYSRNRLARKACLAHFKHKCQVCGFDFEKFYGSMGHEYIHVHHIIDLATIGEEYQVDPLKDLIPVCPNCHAMLHTAVPALPVSELRQIVETYRC